MDYIYIIDLRNLIDGFKYDIFLKIGSVIWMFWRNNILLMFRAFHHSIIFCFNYYFVHHRQKRWKLFQFWTTLMVIIKLISVIITKIELNLNNSLVFKTRFKCVRTYFTIYSFWAIIILGKFSRKLINMIMYQFSISST